MTTVWDVFETTATTFASRTAVEVQRRDGVERYTYGELRDLALGRAGWLAAQGLRAGERCAILADNDAHWCAAYLGILRLGAIAVPLDTNYATAQVSIVVRDAGVRVLLANARLYETARLALEGLDCRLAPLAGDEGADAGPLPPGAAAASDAAVILYTSGTTSDPKGVVLSHGNLLAERDAAFSVVDVSERDSVLGVLPLYHSLAQLANLLLPFAVGARVVYLEQVNSQELLRALSEREISIFACVPQFFYLIHQRVTAEVGRGGPLLRGAFRFLLALNFRLRRIGVNAGPMLFARVHRTTGRAMRLFVTGGSKFDPAIGRDLYALGFTILQAYGLTETSAAATINTPHEAHLDTVGRVLPGNALRIMPPESADVDGEIAIRGPIVMQGYYHRPEATTAVMRDGWFLTGDLGRTDAAGRLTITGRKKEMIVLASGKNIYPEEIEAHYRQSAFIKELCVLGLSTPDNPTTERLHAVVVPNLELMRERRIVNAGDVLRFEIEGLAVGLPSHKRVLGYDIWFDPLPRTTTGKVKRHEVERRLREQRRVVAEQAAAPLGDADQAWLEQADVAPAIAVVRGRVVSGGRVAPDANLELDLGLDSMERVELLTELERQYGTRIPKERAHEIFTVRQLVDALRSGQAGPEAALTERADEADQSWARLLQNLPPDTDPVLSGLLARRLLVTPLLYVGARLLRFCLGPLRVSGFETLPPNGPYLLCPNHQSYLDGMLICSALPYRAFRDLFFVGAAEYFDTPLMRWVARKINCVPVDADSNLVPAMQAGAFGLARGKILMLFPEGERSIDGTVRRFKKGAPILSRHLGVPIVPVAMKGVFELWPRNRPFNWRMAMPGSGHRVRLAAGAAVQVGATDADGATAHELEARVRRMWETL